MSSIKLEFNVQSADPNKPLVITALDDVFNGYEAVALFGEICESVLHSHHREICFDLSKLSFISSSGFGAVINLVELAKKNSRTIRFKVATEVMTTVRLAKLDKLAAFETA